MEVSGHIAAVRHEVDGLHTIKFERVNQGVKFTSVHPHVTKTGMFNNTQAKWPLVFPLLEPEWVADQIIIATKEERLQILLPKITNLFLSVEPLMSVGVYLKYCEVLGNGMMKTFKKIRSE